jgi:hypothetical protein
MKKEIIIAVYQESIEWIPKRWLPQTTIYRCGEPKKSEEHMSKRLRQEMGFPSMVPNVSSQLESMHLFVNLLRELKDLSKDLNSIVPQEPELGSHAERLASNCTNGREAEQWLNHIIWRYDSLADTTIFLQNNPFDHCPFIVELVESNETKKFTPLPFSKVCPAKSLLNEHKNPDGDCVFTLCNNFWRLLESSDLDHVFWSAGAQFAASREAIQSRPLEWYVQVQNASRTYPKSGEALERIWWNILGCPEP